MHANDVSFRSLSVCVFPLSSLSLSLFFSVTPWRKRRKSRITKGLCVGVACYKCSMWRPCCGCMWSCPPSAFKLRCVVSLRVICSRFSNWFVCVFYLLFLHPLCCVLLLSLICCFSPWLVFLSYSNLCSLPWIIALPYLIFHFLFLFYWDVYRVSLSELL